MPPHNLRSMQEPSLCFDVLFALFDHLHKQQHAVALASTCKTMNSFGAKRVLSFGVEINNFAALESFWSFMYSDVDRRGPLLRKLVISIGPEVVPRGLQWDARDIESESDDEEQEAESGEDQHQHPGKRDRGVQAGTDPEEEEFMESVTSVLHAMTRLEELHIGCVEELLLRHSRHIRNAVIGLPALRRLRTTAFGPGTLSLVRGTMAPLVEIDLDLRRHNVSMDRYMGLFEVLESPAFAATLEKITLWNVALGGAGFVWHTLKDKPCFPRVHTFSARGIDGGIYLPALVHAFPNLRTLDLTDLGEGSERDLQAEHQRNKAFGLNGVGWQHLECLCGDLDALYALGSTCVVSRVDVDKVRMTEKDVRRWRSVVDETRPSRLLMHFVKEKDADGYPIAHLGRFFFSQGIWSVTHLALDFEAVLGSEASVVMASLDWRKLIFLRNLLLLRHLIVRVGRGLNNLVEQRGPLDPSRQQHARFDEAPLQTPSGWASALLRWIPQLLSVTVDQTSHTYKKKQSPEGAKIVSDPWWGPGEGQGAANPSNAAKSMQWHRRSAYPRRT